ncbi:MAG: hypothetical protein AMXMBFR61_02750 [Fimbriimonadales bacterium]
MSDTTFFTCEETFRRMKDYVDRELPAAEVALVEMHLKACGACASEYRFEQTLLREMRSKLRSVPTSPESIARLLSNAAKSGEQPK